MLGLIKKDLLVMKGNLKLIILIFLLFIVFALEGSDQMLVVPVLITVMTFLSTFSYDEFNHWDSYACTFPSGRRKVVKSKYLATILLMILSFAISLLIMLILSLFKDQLNLDLILYTILGSAVPMVLLVSFLYPFIFKLGIEKSRIGLFVGVFAVVALIGSLSKLVSISIPEGMISFFENFWPYLLSMILLSLLLISYQISLHIYLKKEFSS